MKKPIAPCLDCTDRDFRCHETCQKYLEYKKLQAVYKDQEKKGRQAASAFGVLWSRSKRKDLTGRKK